ncbi:hypothetical protein PS2_015517 [Malus domestica]
MAPPSPPRAIPIVGPPQINTFAPVAQPNPLPAGPDRPWASPRTVRAPSSPPATPASISSSKSYHPPPPPISTNNFLWPGPTTP